LRDWKDLHRRKLRCELWHRSDELQRDMQEPADGREQLRRLRDGLRNWENVHRRKLRGQLRDGSDELQWDLQELADR
jgi:hypothetical protein